MLAICAILEASQIQFEVLQYTRRSARRDFAIVCSRLTLSSGATVPSQKLPAEKGMALMRAGWVRLLGFQLLWNELFQIQRYLGEIARKLMLLNPLAV
jgi:hypothetical protein